ncbi:hypothetical protein Mkiyose1088_41000 [Mycobacterium kiyosense]|nr:hypothetical protein IWGMT90018_46320 [Mycobacterium kiyosense]BDE15722.1 hypothetical protein MKCMC460_45820 [Mycobacterium sp. 20KCMC460]GJP28509.1 hypothetical protein NJB18091_12570 [Mycobacterium marinum]GLB87378.1 hypothetical protein SRL2020130_01950 [Mycobacterium kiyosense]GLB99572.1 hypothetical protein SRL2020400_01640 [Mycobacterium kiyosense]
MHFVRSAGIGLQASHDHQSIVVAGNGPGAFSMTQDLNFAGLRGLDPHGGVTLTDMAKQRPQHKLGHDAGSHDSSRTRLIGGH